MRSKRSCASRRSRAPRTMWQVTVTPSRECDGAKVQILSIGCDGVSMEHHVWSGSAKFCTHWAIFRGFMSFRFRKVSQFILSGRYCFCAEHQRGPSRVLQGGHKYPGAGIQKFVHTRRSRCCVRRHTCVFMKPSQMVTDGRNKSLSSG